MNDSARLKYLRIALVVVGIIFIFGIYLLMIVWPSGWRWHAGHSDYPVMIVGVYATLGVFLLVAARNPLQYRSLIWFTVWSSVVHAGIMALQSFEMPHNHGHLATCQLCSLSSGAGISHAASRRVESPPRNGLARRYSEAMECLMFEH